MSVPPSYEAQPAFSLDSALLEAVVDTAPVLVVVLDPDGRILRFNRSCEELTGYRSEEVIGRRVWDFLVAAEEVAEVRAAFSQLKIDGGGGHHRNDWVTREGRRRAIGWHNAIVTGPAGEVLRILATGVELTAQLAAEAAAAALRISQARHAGIVSIAADAIISVDEAQRITLFNEGAEAIFGWRAEEVAGQPLDMLIPERFRDAHRSTHLPGFATSPVAARRMGDRREIFGLRRNGEEFPAEASISKLVAGDQRIFTVVLRDVTERMRRAQAQRFLAEVGMLLSTTLDYEETLRALAALSVRGLADLCLVDIVDEGGAMTRVETACASRDLDELARRFKEHPLDRKRPHLSMAALDRREAVRVDELTPAVIGSLAQDPAHRAMLDELRGGSCMAVPLLARERLLGAIVFVSLSRRYDSDDLDVAVEVARRAALAIDNANLYEQAQLAVRARDEVVSIVAHDLGSPLAAIRIAARLLSRDGGAPRVGNHVDSIMNAAGQMDRLISGLLDLSRIREGRFLLDRRPLAPVDLLNTVADEFRLHALDNGLDLQVESHASVPSIAADHARLLQVFENLVGNAVKFTPSGGSVRLAVRASVDELLFEVSDTGPGMRDDQLEEIFGRYWQGIPTHRRSVGLGLAIARGIVEAHGGRIWASSELGKGSVFHVSLPVNPSALRRDAIPLGLPVQDDVLA